MHQMSDAELVTPPAIMAVDRPDALGFGAALGFGFIGWFVGVLLSTVAAVSLADSLGYDLGQAGGEGSSIGRSAMQLAENQPLSNDAAPIQFLALSNLPLWIALLLTPLFIAAMMHTAPRILYGLRATSSDIPTGIATGVVMQFAAVPLYLLLFELIGDQDLSGPARELAERAHGWGVIVFVIMVVVVAPITEELFFRGLVFGALSRIMPAWAAIGVSALIFAAVHLQLLQSIALFLLGAVLAFLVHRTGRLGPAIIAHAAFNGVTVLALL